MRPVETKFRFCQIPVFSNYTVYVYWSNSKMILMLYNCNTEYRKKFSAVWYDVAMNK